METGIKYLEDEDPVVFETSGTYEISKDRDKINKSPGKIVDRMTDAWGLKIEIDQGGR
jgi:hypothetical protein